MTKATVIVMASLVVFVASPIMGQTKKPTTKPSKTKQLKAKLSTVQQKKKAVKTKLHQVKVQVWYTAADVERLDGQIRSVETKISSTKSQLSRAKARQAVLDAALAEAHKRLLAKQRLAARRIRSIYTSRSSTVLSVLMGSKNVAEFASRKSLLERIAKHDKNLFDTLKKLRDEVRDKKRKQDQVVSDIAQLRARLQMQEQDLAGAKSQKQKTLSQLKSKREDLEEELEAMERESSRIEAQIRAFQVANSGRLTPYRGRFMLPVSGRFSSGYGYRVHPISGVRKMHTGQDIAAPYGTRIRAAGPGVVISTGWRGGYGNTVIIDHGGGVSTLYGHCSRVFAKSGQKVSAGTPIAAVGSTGYSTGPHLHFEVRVNGRPVNPRSYL